MKILEVDIMNQNKQELKTYFTILLHYGHEDIKESVAKLVKIYELTGKLPFSL